MEIRTRTNAIILITEAFELEAFITLRGVSLRRRNFIQAGKKNRKPDTLNMPKSIFIYHDLVHTYICVNVCMLCKLHSGTEQVYSEMT